MNPAETEFIAERVMVGIVPNFNFEVVHLISGDIGPFRAGLPVKVPIWLAMNLKRRQKCRIVAPSWMNMDELERVKADELDSSLFTKMPSEHYMVEAQLLLSVAADDISRCDQIRTILKDIWDIRMSKLRSSVDAFIKAGGSHAKLDHLTLIEINSVRPLLPDALDQLYRMQGITHNQKYLGGMFRCRVEFLANRHFVVYSLALLHSKQEGAKDLPSDDWLEK